MNIMSRSQEGLRYAGARTFAGAAYRDELWIIIWTAGGVCWLTIATINILWAWPIAGTWMNGDYVLSSGSRAILHGLLFLVSACAYHVALDQRQATSVLARARTVALHLLLAVFVVRVAPIFTLLVAGVVDGKREMLDRLASWLPLRPTFMDDAGLLRTWMPSYVIGLAAVALVRMARNYHEESTRLAHLSTEYSNLRLAMLSAQLQPHFLFNALHAAAELINENPAQAVTMLARLGEFLRYALESTKQPWIRVADEMVGVRAYLMVQQTRFRDRLQVQREVEPEAQTLIIPALLLQPLVENAIEHGRCSSEGLVVVNVKVRHVQGRLIVYIANNTPRLPGPLTRSAYGDGLSNVEGRLRAAYGERASLTIGPDSVRGTCAELNMPADVASHDMTIPAH